MGEGWHSQGKIHREKVNREQWERTNLKLEKIQQEYGQVGM
jgi:hypothetical protein